MSFDRFLHFYAKGAINFTNGCHLDAFIASRLCYAHRLVDDSSSPSIDRWIVQNIYILIDFDVLDTLKKFVS